MAESAGIVRPMEPVIELDRRQPGLIRIVADDDLAIVMGCGKAPCSCHPCKCEAKKDDDRPSHDRSHSLLPLLRLKDKQVKFPAHLQPSQYDLTMRFLKFLNDRLQSITPANQVSQFLGG
jgi:hypothetical protein